MSSTDLYQWTRLSGTAAGTTTVSSRNGNLKTVLIGQNQTGTVTFYDTNSATASTKLICTLNNNSGSIPTALDVSGHFKEGLVAVLGGTTDMTVFWN